MTSYQVLFFWCLHSNYLWLPWNCFSLCKRRVNWQRELSKFSSRHIDFFRMMKAHVDSVVYEGWQKGIIQNNRSISSPQFTFLLSCEFMEEIAYITDVHNESLLTREGWGFYTQEAYLLPDMETKVWWCSTYFFFLSNKKCVERKEGGYMQQYIVRVLYLLIRFLGWLRNMLNFTSKSRVNIQ